MKLCTMLQGNSQFGSQEETPLIRDFLYEKYESEFQEWEREEDLDPQEDLLNQIVWAPRI